MKKNRLFNKIQTLSVATLAVAALASCSNEPDGEDLYTSTGKTITDYITEDPDLSYFYQILQHVELDKSLAAYGQYTCFAPSNAGIVAYIDSLYNDTNSPIPHNGLSSNSMDGLNDSLCNDIAKYHLLSGISNVIDLTSEEGGGGGKTLNTMLGYPVSTSIDAQGRTTLNDVAHIVSPDNEAVNGIFHKLDNVIGRDTRLLPDVLHSLTNYSIFYEALVKTGLCDSVLKKDKGITYSLKDKTDTNGSELYSPTECKIRYTISPSPTQ